MLAALTLVGAAQAVTTTPTVAPGYTLSVFAAPLAGNTGPDTVVYTGGSVFVAYGNQASTDGTAVTTGNPDSTIAEYNVNGGLMRQWSILGHTEGLRVDPSTGLLWANQNEDSASTLAIFNPNSTAAGAIPTSDIYHYPVPSAHAGGHDDIAFYNGNAYVVNSSPDYTNPNPPTVNNHFAVEQVSVSGGVLHTQGVLAGTALATNVQSGKTVTLNVDDPDSLTLDAHGNLAFMDESNNQIDIIHSPGTSSQTVHQLLLYNSSGQLTNIDDAAWATGAGSMLISDNSGGAIYKLSGPNIQNDSAFTVSPGSGTVGSLNLTTGVITPVVTGLGKPHGIDFLPSNAGGSAVPEPNALVLLPLAMGALALRQRAARA